MHTYYILHSTGTHITPIATYIHKTYNTHYVMCSHYKCTLTIICVATTNAHWLYLAFNRHTHYTNTYIYTWNIQYNVMCSHYKCIHTTPCIQQAHTLHKYLHNTYNTYFVMCSQVFLNVFVVATHTIHTISCVATTNTFKNTNTYNTYFVMYYL